MAITRDFKYYAPVALNEALEILGEYGKKAVLLAGGTDLVVNLKEDVIAPEAVMDIKKIGELKTIDREDRKLFIGAKCTFSDIIDNQQIRKDYLLLWESARSVASVGIRNRATLVGNICSAVPCMDSAPALLCYEGSLQIINSSGKREIPVKEWFIAPRKTVLKTGEIVTGVSLSLPRVKHTGCYIKLGRCSGEDLAQAGLAILITAEHEYRIAFTSVGPIPKRAHQIENLFSGKEIDSRLIKQAQELVADEISPITDIRASREYREHICRVMLERGLLACRDRLSGKEVDLSRILGG